MCLIGIFLLLLTQDFNLPFWADEIIYVKRSFDILNNPLNPFLGYNKDEFNYFWQGNANFVYEYITAFLYSIFKNNVVFRVVSFLFIIIDYLAIFLFTKKIFNHTIAYLTVLFFVISWPFIYYSLKITSHPVCFVFFIGSLYFFYNWINKNKKMFFLLGTMLFSFSIVNALEGFLIIPIVMSWIVIKKDWQKTLQFLLLFVLIMLFVYNTPLMKISLNYFFPKSINAEKNINFTTDYFLFFFEFVAPIFLILGTFSTFIISIVIRNKKIRIFENSHLFLISWLIVTLVGFSFLTFIPNTVWKNPAHLIYAEVPFFIILGTLLTNLSKLKEKKILLLLILIILIAEISLFPKINQLFDSNSISKDYATTQAKAAEYLSNTKTNNKVIIDLISVPSFSTFEFYIENKNLSVITPSDCNSYLKLFSNETGKGKYLLVVEKKIQPLYDIMWDGQINSFPEVSQRYEIQKCLISKVFDNNKKIVDFKNNHSSVSILLI
jgi:4-amino-4-deoxy-L-arabinose transferase-like glycosyltransferase